MVFGRRSRRRVWDHGIACLAAIIAALTIAGCASIPEGFWHQCVDANFYGLYNMGQAGVTGIGYAHWQRNTAQCQQSEDSAEPKLPSAATTLPFDEFLCTATPKGEGLVLECGTYESWKRWAEKQKKSGT